MNTDPSDNSQDQSITIQIHHPKKSRRSVIGETLNLIDQSPSKQDFEKFQKLLIAQSSVWLIDHWTKDESEKIQRPHDRSIIITNQSITILGLYLHIFLLNPEKTSRNNLHPYSSFLSFDYDPSSIWIHSGTMRFKYAGSSSLSNDVFFLLVSFRA